MAKRFRSEVFEINDPGDSHRYETIKQSALVDRDGKFEIVKEQTHWDVQDGSRYVALEYIERDEKAEERW